MKKIQRGKKVPFPSIDGTAEPGKKYLTKNSRATDQQLYSKELIAIDFKNRFGSFPEIVFYGKPDGSLLYAGPVPEQYPNNDPELNPTQLSFIESEKDPNGNHYQST